MRAMLAFQSRSHVAVYLLAFLALLTFATAVSLRTHDSTFQPDYVLYATGQNISLNCETRYSVVMNGSSPGPPIYLRENQTTWIRVYNNITGQNLTSHWHGLSQRTAPFSDGTPQVSQWPIPPGYFFDYEVRPDIGDAGTYFYHSHVDFQAISAHGPLIVEDAACEKPYKYDDEITLLLSDYYRKPDEEIIHGLLSNPFKWSGETNGLLVNGQSGQQGLGNSSDASCAPHQIDVQPDTTYRMRIVGGTGISLITLGIEGHDNLTIIEADGAYTKPANVNHMQVASGQRFSLLFKTKSAAELISMNKTSFWIRYENRGRPANASGYALLNYDVPSVRGVPKSLPTVSPVTLPERFDDWLEYTLQSLDPSVSQAFPRQATRTVKIQLNQIGNYTNGTFSSTLQWANNNNVWQDFKVQMPYLVSIYGMGQLAVPNYDAALNNQGWDPATQVFPAKVGEILDIVWENNNLPTGGWDIHPMHAHGGHYWDLGSGNGTYNATENNDKFANFTPAKRDTTMLYRYAPKGVLNTTAGWRAWRLKVDVAGVWMMHCHVLQHMIMGMQTVWSMGDAQQITYYAQPYIDGYLMFGGSAYGNDTWDPVVMHAFDRKNSAPSCIPKDKKPQVGIGKVGA